MSLLGYRREQLNSGSWPTKTGRSCWKSSDVKADFMYKCLMGWCNSAAMENTRREETLYSVKEALLYGEFYDWLHTNASDGTAHFSLNECSIRGAFVFVSDS